MKPNNPKNNPSDAVNFMPKIRNRVVAKNWEHLTEKEDGIFRGTVNGFSINIKTTFNSKKGQIVIHTYTQLQSGAGAIPRIAKTTKRTTITIDIGSNVPHIKISPKSFWKSLIRLFISNKQEIQDYPNYAITSNNISFCKKLIINTILGTNIKAQELKLVHTNPKKKKAIIQLSKVFSSTEEIEAFLIELNKIDELLNSA